MLNLEKLFPEILKEEHYFLDAHQSRISFYSTIIATILGATIAGAAKVDNKNAYLLLLVGPLIVIALAHLGTYGTRTFYRRYLESVTVRAKMEQTLGLTKAQDGDSSDSVYWKGEAFIPERHVEARKEFATSGEFVSKRMSMGYQKATEQLFSAFLAIAIILALVLIMIHVVMLIAGA